MARKLATETNSWVVNGVAIENLDQLKAALAVEVKSVKVFRNGTEMLLEAAVSL